QQAEQEPAPLDYLDTEDPKELVHPITGEPEIPDYGGWTEGTSAIITKHSDGTVTWRRMTSEELEAMKQDDVVKGLVEAEDYLKKNGHAALIGPTWEKTLENAAAQGWTPEEREADALTIR